MTHTDIYEDLIEVEDRMMIGSTSQFVRYDDPEAIARTPIFAAFVQDINYQQVAFVSSNIIQTVILRKKYKP